MRKYKMLFRFIFSIVICFVFHSTAFGKGNLPTLEKNKVFSIKEEYDLQGKLLSIPEGCVLKFEGGSISNGTLSSNTVFPIVAGLSQIFNNIRFEIKRLETIKINAEWFGVDRNNSDVVNSINLQKLFNSNRNLHVAFQDGMYRFSIQYPVRAIGRSLLTGETAGFFSDTPRTWFVITGNPVKPEFFLTFDTERVTLKHIMFLTLNGNDYKKYRNVGCVFIRDGVNPGNIDSAIDACMFYNVGCSVKAYGRGLSITNTRFQEGGGIVLKQTKSEGNNLSQQPPYDGRGLFLDNIRLHWPARGIHASGEDSPFGTKDFTLITIQHNNEVDNSAFFGVIMNNIYADGACRLLDCDSDVKSLILTNVFCARPLNDFILFKRNVSNLIISKMITENNYQYISERSGDRLLTFRGNIEDCLINDNIFGGVKKQPIAVIGKNKHVISNMLINNNIFKDVHNLLGLENTEVTIMRIQNNIIERAEDYDQEVVIHGDSRSTKLLQTIIDN